MFSLIPRKPDRVISRRAMLKLGSLAAGALAVPRLLHAADTLRQGRTASRCIYIFLCGGPSQPDLWDMKPLAPAGIRSTFKPVPTSVPGLHFGELLPQVAQHADKLALVRSMTHGNNDHNGAIVHSLLGQLPTPPGALYMSRSDQPGLGSIVHKFLGEANRLPAWVILPRLFTTYSPPYKGQSAGFLGSSFDPLLFAKEAKGSLTDAPLRLDALQPPQGVDKSRLAVRRTLQKTLDPARDALDASRLGDFYDQAFALLSDAATRDVFNLDREPASLRERYGRNEYGQSFLMARRLIESGVRFVNVFWTFFDTKGCQFNLWDNHGVPSDVCGIDGQLTGLQQLTHQYCTPSFDKAFSALLEDLEQRGLLEETLVVLAGEFGRTPRINVTAGRDHWAHCYTQLLAGGGVRGGAVHGASDRLGAYVKDAPVTPDDFAATVLHAFGISPETMIEDTLSRPVRVCTGTPVTSLFG